MIDLTTLYLYKNKLYKNKEAEDGKKEQIRNTFRLGSSKTKN